MLHTFVHYGLDIQEQNGNGPNLWRSNITIYHFRLEVQSQVKRRAPPPPTPTPKHYSIPRTHTHTHYSIPNGFNPTFKTLQ